MRKAYSEALKGHFHNSLCRIRTERKMTQSEMAEKLAMDERSYIDLDHGKTCCSAVTLALYLIYVCDDVEKFLKELRCAFETASHRAA